MLILPILIQIAANATSPCVPFKGGPADGMCPGEVVIKDGQFEVVALQPAGQTGAPIAPETLATISALIRSQHSGAPVDQGLLAAGATEEFCETFSKECMTPHPFESWPIGKEFVSNRPYGLADGRIRIEWVRDGKLQFLSMIRLDGTKVADVSTAPAQIPVKAGP